MSYVLRVCCNTEYKKNYFSQQSCCKAWCPYFFLICMLMVSCCFLTITSCQSYGLKVCLCKKPHCSPCPCPGYCLSKCKCKLIVISSCTFLSRNLSQSERRFDLCRIFMLDSSDTAELKHLLTAK